ncbi:hypothetical protein [Actinomadura rugatobispora]|uniref:Uncharacterized protein n=1 Tax=Actinomadura rugatobispora TaxID=1994 RepID=A0ABW0ZMY2_9ACTN|nr:hypothetical protein GCM10010200_024850 [Actinomadura rugatobispora]
MLDLLTELRRTPTSLWTESAFGTRSLNAPPDGERPKPRPQFCRAVVRHLAEMDGGTDFAAVRIGRDELKRRTGHQGEGTLYATFGPNAQQSLASLLAAEMGSTFAVRDAVRHVLAETKVWSHRPHRDGWLAALEDGAAPSRRFAAETLVRVLADWTARNPRLARSAGHLPPPTAVQDLCVISGGRASSADARVFLAEVVRVAAGFEGASAQAVLNAVHDDLMRLLAIGHSDYADELVRNARESLGEIEYMWPHLGPDERERVATRLGPIVGDLYRRMDKDES